MGIIKFSPTEPTYQDQALMFRAIPQERIPNAVAKPTGALLQENGDILFRIYAPQIREVVITVANRRIDLQQDADGYFEGLYQYDPEFCGPHTIEILFDGTSLLSPYIPISWQKNHAVNYVEIPDPETAFCMIRDVPHGAVTREIYFSQQLKCWLRCLVYTPPGYRTSYEDYPVLYLQHGNSENETTWEYLGRMSYIIDNLISEKKCVPMIVVLNDGMVGYRHRQENESAVQDTGFEDNLLGSCIPFIEANYRVRSQRKSRAIAGLSAGASQSITIALNHPDVFSSFGMFSGSISRRSEAKLLNMRRMLDINLLSQYDVIFRSIGGSEIAYSLFCEEDAAMKEAGTASLPCYHSVIYSGQFHEYGCWRRALHDFLPLLFR